MPVSKTSSSGRMPASRMRSASATIVCGALRLALSRKFSEPSVRLAMSGFSSPAERQHVGALVELRVRAAAGATRRAQGRGTAARSSAMTAP